jgi:hypothetical protein
LEIDKKAYAAGDKGKVTATFTVTAPPTALFI